MQPSSTRFKQHALWRMSAFLGGLLLVAAAGTAQARDLQWSIGIQSPGVSVGVANHGPVVVYPQPVYVYPPAVVPVRPPQPGYVQPVVVYPGAPAAVWGYPGYGHPGHRHGHGHKHRHDRWDRDDDRRWR